MLQLYLHLDFDQTITVIVQTKSNLISLYNQTYYPSLVTQAIF